MISEDNALTRRDFTVNICKLILEMAEAGDQPIIDYALRSEAEQKRLYDAGLSKCDGKDKMSKHQMGTAMDIYLCHHEDDKIKVDFEWNAEKSEKWHKRWEEFGGSPEIIWDRGHFQGA